MYKKSMKGIIAMSILGMGIAFYPIECICLMIFVISMAIDGSSTITDEPG